MFFTSSKNIGFPRKTDPNFRPAYPPRILSLRSPRHRLSPFLCGFTSVPLGRASDGTKDQPLCASTGEIRWKGADIVTWWKMVEGKHTIVLQTSNINQSPQEFQSSKSWWIRLLQEPGSPAGLAEKVGGFCFPSKIKLPTVGTECFGQWRRRNHGKISINTQRGDHLQLWSWTAAGVTMPFAEGVLQSTLLVHYVGVQPLSIILQWNQQKNHSREVGKLSRKCMEMQQTHLSQGLCFLVLWCFVACRLAVWKLKPAFSSL